MGEIDSPIVVESEDEGQTGTRARFESREDFAHNFGARGWLAAYQRAEIVRNRTVDGKVREPSDKEKAKMVGRPRIVFSSLANKPGYTVECPHN